MAGLAVLIWWLITRNRKPSPPPKHVKYAWGVPAWASQAPAQRESGGSGEIRKLVKAGDKAKTRLLHFEACSPPTSPNPAMQKTCDAHQFVGLDAACASQPKGTGMCASYQCYEVKDDGTFAPATDPKACDTGSAVYDLTDPQKPQQDPKLSGGTLQSMAPDGKLYCTCSSTPPPPPPPVPDCGVTINTDSSLNITGITLDPSNYADNATKFNKILMEGNLYGEQFTIQCNGKTPVGQDKISSLFCPAGQQVQLCPNSISTNTAEACRANASCAKCANIFGPVGAALNLEVDSNFEYKSHTFTNVDVAGCTSGTSYRGVCIPETMGGKPVTDDASLPDKSLPFKIALYHGGKAGLPEINVGCMASYLYEVAQFVTYRKIDRVFISVDSPLPYDVNGVAQQNSYFLQPQFLVANFLRLLPPKTEVGIIAYASPSDSGWNFQSCSPYTGKTEAEKAIAATCDAQWAKHADLFPIHCDDPTDPSCANCRATECFSNPYAQQLMGGDINKDQPSCDKFPFVPLSQSANVCVTPCEGSLNCYDALKTVDCAGSTQAEADAVCATFVDGHCAPYNTRGTVSCGSQGKCTMCVPSEEKDDFTRCANCANCCPQSVAPATDVPACSSSTFEGVRAEDGERYSEMQVAYQMQVEKEANKVDDVMLQLPKSLMKDDAMPCGCPNIASQIVAYVTAINDAVDRLAPHYAANGQTFAPVKITMIAYDGEDAHQNNQQGGQCQFVEMVSVLDPKIKVYEQSLSRGVGLYAKGNKRVGKTRLAASTCGTTTAPTCSTAAGDANPNRPTKLGHAYSMTTGPYKWVLDPDAGKSFVPTGVTDSYSMEEMYWFMGINFPCVGSSHQIGKTDGWQYAFPPVCTNLLPYNDAINVAKLNATQFYMWIKMVQKCAPGGGNFKGMVGQMMNYRNRVWPMISCEGLSAGKPGGPEAGDPSKDQSPWCFARKANKNGDTQASICGTFDGVYVWDDWNTVLHFMNAIYRDTYLNEWGMFDETPMDPKNKKADDDPCIALYEVQFIRPSWMPGKTFGAPVGRPSDITKYDASVYTGGTGLTACQGSCADLAPQCDTKVAHEKQCDPTVVGSCAYNLQKEGRGDCVKGFDFSCKTGGTCSLHPQGAGAPACGAGDTALGDNQRAGDRARGGGRGTEAGDRARGEGRGTEAGRMKTEGMKRAVPQFVRYTGMQDVEPVLQRITRSSGPLGPLSPLSPSGPSGPQSQARGTVDPQISHPPNTGYYDRSRYAWSILRPHHSKANAVDDSSCSKGGCGALCKGGPDGKGCCCAGAPTCTTDNDCCEAYGYADGCKNTCCNNGTCSITAAMAPCTTGDDCDGTDGNCCPGLGNKCVPYASSYLCGRKSSVVKGGVADDPTCGPPASEACGDGDTCVCKFLSGAAHDTCASCKKNSDCAAPGDSCLPCKDSKYYPQCDKICPPPPQ